ncbi:uncharacterized protein BXZ73DRAFT_87039 [Epithele typhae]|uniref:uncharacterized protein n=1 Tax=Epithele typhae TaxID=378194 RepID=UPI0020080FE8|nr:uncharacterized protein BXZ73DRAFT_87039 [Epithele typhae]KAH9944074.1 hypothetical protein BXZ73DRAFT_87039 [Epithele typhae]
MSLSELTRNAFQSGLPAQKWLSLSKLFISKNLPHNTAHSIETDISNSVLTLFLDYPGEPTLQSYLKHAIEDGLLSLPTFLAVFLPAAQSPNFHSAATLDMLCRVVLDHHYASGSPTAWGSSVPFGETPARLLTSIHYAMSLLRTSYIIPVSPVHQLHASAAELLLLLLGCVTEEALVSTAQAALYLNEMTGLLTNMRIPFELRQALDGFRYRLSNLLGDDVQAVQSNQMPQFGLGRAESVLTSGSETDIVTFGLLLNHLIFNRASDYGSGDTPRAVAMLVALLRSSSWTPAAFYAQLIITCLTCLTQSYGPSGPSKASAIWRAFIVGRLPHLLVLFRKIGRPDNISEADWHLALQNALPHITSRTDLLEKLDNNGQTGGSDTASDRSMVSHTFISEFLYQLLSVGIMEQGNLSSFGPNSTNDFHPRVATDAQEAGVDLIGYFEGKLSSESSPEDIEVMLYRAWKDPCSHSAFAEVVVKRFTSSTKSMDAESLGLVCRMLHKNDMALDMLSLHAKIIDLVAHALLFVDDYDCETVGDPQSAVTYVGDLGWHPFSVGDKRVGVDFMRATTLQRQEGMKSEDVAAASAWTKALFDPSSDGIEDSILRSSDEAKTILKISPMIFTLAIYHTGDKDKKMDKEALNNGVSYFLGPVLNWTLAGVVRCMLVEIQRRSYNAPMFLDVLKTIVTSSSCPPPVLSLTAPFILRMFPDPLPASIQKFMGNFDVKPIVEAARRALGAPAPAEGMPTPPHVNMTWSSQSIQLITGALTAERAGRAPALDVDRCLLLRPPTKFLTDLWEQLVTAATHVGETEAPRRLATFVLTAPRRLVPHRCSRWHARVTVDLLVGVISTSLTVALHLEWAMGAACGEERSVLGQSVASMARRLPGDLRRRGAASATARTVLERLTAMQPFVANFPTFAAEV